METPIITTAQEGRRRTSAAVALRAVRACWNLVCVAIILAVLALGASWHLYGMVPVAVQSGSMEPTLPVRSLLLVEEVPAERVKVGDIITFDPPGTAPRTTHRVVERERHAGRWYFVTKGDANPVADDWRRATQQDAPSYQRGVSYGDQPAIRYAFHVPQLGRLTDLNQVPHLRRALYGLPFALIAILVLRAIWAPVPAPSRDDDDVVPDADPVEPLDAERSRERPAA